MHALKLISTFVGPVLLATPAAADPIDDFMARVNQYLGAAGGSLTYSIGPGYSDANKGLTPLVLNTPTGEAIPLGSNGYIGAVSTLPGDIILGEGLHFTDLNRSFAGVTATASSVILDLALPPLGTSDPLILAQSVKGASVFEFHVEEDGVALDIAQIGYFMFVAPEIGAPNPTNLTFNFSVEGLAVTDAMLQKLDAPPTLSLLAGHIVDLEIKLDWKRDVAQLTPVSLGIHVADFGELAFSIDLGGVTDDMVMRLVALGQQLSSTGSTPELQQGVLNAFNPVRLPGERQPIATALRTALDTVRPTLPATVTVTEKIGAEPALAVPPGEMLQIISNLLSNAIRAMDGSGAIAIALTNEDDAVLLVFADNGPGMPDHIRERASEPFVTGRPDGTGLGLAVVANIVRNWHGEIEIRSEPRQGTEIHIRIAAILGSEDEPTYSGR